MIVRKYIILLFTAINSIALFGQINTDRVTLIGRNALYFEDYLLAIQYFNQVIKAKPYLAEPYFYRAIAKFYLDDYKGAEDDCSLCLERNPFYNNAYQLRADARQSQKKYDLAIEDYAISLKNIPDDKFILINLGIANIERKNYEEAEQKLNRLVEVYPSYTQGILTRAQLHLEQKDTIKAFEDYNMAIEKDKYSSMAYSMRAQLYFNQGEYDKAIADFDEAIQLEPVLTGNYINRGLTRYYKNDLRGSMADYDHVVEVDPSNLIAHFNRALLRAQVGDDNKAIEDFDFVIEHEPENYIAYMNRGMLKNNIGDISGALSDINIVLKAHPDFYQGYYLRSEILRTQNKLKDAERDYMYARRVEQETRKDVFSGKTEDKADDGKTRETSDKSIDKFNLLVVADKEETEKSKYSSDTRGKIQNRQAKVDPEPQFIVSYYEKESEIQRVPQYIQELDEINKQKVLSRRLIITNREVPLDSAQVEIHFSSINEYSKLIGENPETSLYYFARGLDYMLVQDFTSAIEDFTKATIINPRFLLAHFNLAVAYAKQMESRESFPELYAQETAQSELSVNLQLADRAVSSGTIKESDINTKKLQSRLEYETILRAYDKVMELSPDFAYAYYNRGQVKERYNDYRAAILDYNEAIKRYPEFAEAYYNRGLSRLKAKDTERGLDDLRKAGELGIVSAYSIIKRMTE